MLLVIHHLDELWNEVLMEFYLDRWRQIVQQEPCRLHRLKPYPRVLTREASDTHFCDFLDVRLERFLAGLRNHAQEHEAHDLLFPVGTSNSSFDQSI